jgi:hypothetical protein
MAVQHDPADITVPNPPPVSTPKLDPGVGSVAPSNGGAIQSDGRQVSNAPGPYGVEVPRPERTR